MAVFIAAVVALVTRNSWADKKSGKPAGLLVTRVPPTTLGLGAPSTTIPLITTTIPLPVPSTTRPGTRPTITTIPATPVTTRPGTATTVTTSSPPTTKGAAGTFDQRSDNDASFKYGPNAQDRDGGTEGSRSSKGALAYVVSGQADSDTAWHVGATITNNSGREVRFDGGIDAVIHLSCGGGTTSEQHLHDGGVTTMPAGGGVVLRLDIARIDTGPGTCSLYGTIHYVTA
jgi:hypothetical protein